MSFNWERDSDAEPAAAGPPRLEWEASSDSSGGSDSDAEEPDPLTDPRAASRECLNELLAQYLECNLSARSLTTICFWAARAGAVGDIEKYGKAPGSRHCQEHLDGVLGFKLDDENQYELDLVGGKLDELSLIHI